MRSIRTHNDTFGLLFDLLWTLGLSLSLDGFSDALRAQPRICSSNFHPVFSRICGTDIRDLVLDTCENYTRITHYTVR